jgi:hypothetical protein
VLQQPAARPPLTTEEAKPVTPLLIELQRGQYVRYAGGERSGDAGATQRGSKAIVKDEHGSASAAELPPAILLFRDGHREEATSYTIVGGTMYINANYWTSGAWTRKVQLAELDLPGTMKLNQARGVKFALPSAPNEVLTRP